MSDLTRGSIAGHLVALAGPSALGLLSMTALNLIDTLFVARLGTPSLAALGFVGPLVFATGAVGMGLSTAVTVRVARSFGRGDAPHARRLVRGALAAALLVGGAIGVAVALLGRPLVEALGASPGVAAQAESYLRVWSLGVPFILVGLTGGGALRAAGDARTPSLALALGAGVNAALDPLLLFGLGWGLPAVAAATVAARGLTAALVLRGLHRRGLLGRSARGDARLPAVWRELAATGLPAAAGQAALPVTTAVVTALVARHGQPAVAAFAAAGRVETLALLPFLALGSAMAPFTGQNLGADRADRVRRAWAGTRRFVRWAGPAAWAGLALTAPLLASGFGLGPDARAAFVLHLRLVPAALAFQGILTAAGATLNASGRPLSATILTLLRAPVLTVPLAGAGGQLLGLPGVLGGLALANALAGLLAVGWLERGLRPAPGAPPRAWRGPLRPSTTAPWTACS